MILVDANLLIYAVDQDSPHHDKARRWLEETLSGTAETGLAWIVVLAFLRITTHPKIMRKPNRGDGTRIHFELVESAFCVVHPAR